MIQGSFEFILSVAVKSCIKSWEILHIFRFRKLCPTTLFYIQLQDSRKISQNNLNVKKLCDSEK